MNNVLPFLAINLLFILANVVGAGVLMVGHAVMRESDNVVGWIVVAIVAIGCAVAFLRGALQTCQQFINRRRS